jgi:hypothetical protein
MSTMNMTVVREECGRDINQDLNTTMESLHTVQQPDPNRLKFFLKKFEI